MAKPRPLSELSQKNRVFFIPEPEPAPHLCGNCKTPTGKSSITCKNEPEANG